MKYESTSSLEFTAPGLGRRVLLVDDNLAQLKLARLQLEYAGFQVDIAEGAAAAEALISGGIRPDAIVSDVIMDGIDGFALCRRLRQNPLLDHVPVILMSSAFDEDEDRMLARSLGASALVGRSSNQQSCIEALVRSLAEGAPSPLKTDAKSLHDNRVTHQLVRLSERRTLAEARYATLFEHASDAIAFLTADGIVLDVNAKWEELEGSSCEELRGRHVGDVAILSDERVRSSILAPRSSAAAERPSPTVLRRSDGSALSLEFTTTRVEMDGSPVIMVTGRDVTSLVEANRLLEASERHYRSLVENVPDVIWSATPDWQYTFFSPNIERVTGYSVDDLLAGEHGASLARVHPDDLARVQAARQAIVEDGGSMDVECRWQHRDGRWLWIHLRAVRTATGIDGCFSDVTDRKQLEEQFFQAQKLEAIGQLTAGVAHDFNNILAVVIINASQLLHLLPEGGSAREVASDIMDAGVRATELTKQLLAFSRRRPCAPAQVDLKALISGMSRLLQRTVGSGIALKLPEAAALDLVQADPTQLEQVIMNLAVNARDAMGSTGALTIDAAHAEVDGHSSSKVPPGRYVRLSITDSGCGIDETTKKHLFEPFFTTKSDGTGLGLTTCYGIVRNAGGHIEVDSALGQGTTFHVYLPRVCRASSSLRPMITGGRTPSRPSSLQADVVKALAPTPLERRSLPPSETQGTLAGQLRDARFQG